MDLFIKTYKYIRRRIRKYHYDFSLCDSLIDIGYLMASVSYARTEGQISSYQAEKLHKMLWDLRDRALCEIQSNCAK